MTKKSKILIILLSVALALVLYLILTSESVKQSENFSQQEAKPDNAAVRETNYQAKVKQIYSDYEKLDRDNNFTVEKINELKNKLLDLKVPAKFKQLHIQFVLALIKMENYFSQKNEQAKSDSLRLVSQLKADYGWLNN